MHYSFAYYNIGKPFLYSPSIHEIGPFHNHGTQTMDDNRICVCHHTGNIILWNEPSLVFMDTWTVVFAGHYGNIILWNEPSLVFMDTNVCHHNIILWNEPSLVFMDTWTV